MAHAFERRPYAYAGEVGAFLERAARHLNPLALILFGSLARGDYHSQSDADVCIVLQHDLPSPLAGYDQAAAIDPSGVVQPLVYGAAQFRRMIREANGLALEVMADGIFVAGDEGFREEIEGLAEDTHRRLGVRRTPGGWRIAVRHDAT